MAIRYLPGYPMPLGAKYMVAFDIDGPAAYNNTGTFATSGQQVNATDLGFGGFDYVECDGLSLDGINAIQIVQGATILGATNLATAPGAQQSAVAFTTFVMHWYTTPSSATEVNNGVNLSGKAVRIRAVCP